ncbi:MAG: hypothetical protein ACREBR_05245 [bacterium]
MAKKILSTYYYKIHFKELKKSCEICGIAREVPDKGFKFCKKCQVAGRLEYKIAINDAVQRLFRTWKQERGCSRCSYNRYGGSLDFHHIDFREKEGHINGWRWYRKNEFYRKEIKKCILVCKNCHYELHSRE